MCRLQKQYDFFRRNRSGLMADYKGQVLVIAEDLTVHAFPSMSEAYTFGAQHYGLGNFMVQACTEKATRIQAMSNIGLKVL